MFDWWKERKTANSLDGVMDSRIDTVVSRGPLPKCGGCGSESAKLQIVRDKKGNRGYLCPSCSEQYKQLLTPDSIRNFWMCGVCGYRVLTGTDADASVDQSGNPCPNCTADVNISLVNLSGDRPVGRGLIGEPAD